MAGTVRTMLGLLCAAALISMPTLQAAPASQDVALVAVAPIAVKTLQDDYSGRASVARDDLPRGGLSAAETLGVEDAASNPTASGAPDNGTWLWPTPSRLITSPFGFRSDPLNSSVAFHSGTDFGEPCGTMVGTTRPGAVTFAGPAGGYGLRVVVDHGEGIWSSYSHLQEISVRVGDVLTQSHAVGLVGTTGRSTGCHLHFEIIVNGGFADPMPYLTGNPVANPTTFGNGNIVAEPTSTADPSSPPSSSAPPSASPDPCDVSTDPQDAIDSGGLIPVPGVPSGSATDQCQTPSPSPTPTPESSSASPNSPSSIGTTPGTVTPSSPVPSEPVPSSPTPGEPVPSSPAPSEPTSGSPTSDSPTSSSPGPSSPVPSGSDVAATSDEPSSTSDLSALPVESPSAALATASEAPSATDASEPA